MPDGSLFVLEQRPAKRKRWTIGCVEFSRNDARQQMKDMQVVDKNTGNSGKFEYRIAEYKRSVVEI